VVILPRFSVIPERLPASEKQYLHPCI